MLEDSPQPPITLDVELLIQEIKKRPVLWNRLIPEYNDRFLKNKQWEEVNEAIFYDWKDLGSADKQSRDEEVKKKWRNFRDQFVRELANQKKVKKGRAKRKRPYQYFEDLSFLLEQFKDKKNDSSSECSDDEDDESNIKTVFRPSDISIDVDTLIREVKSRPILWNKQLNISEHYVRQDKNLIWEKVCEVLFENWSQFKPSTKELIHVEVKNKWRNLRNAFGRELTMLKKVKLGTMKPKKPYRYFKELSFLFGTFENKDDYSFMEDSQMEIEAASSNYSLSEYEDETTAPDAEPKHQKTDECAKTYDEDVCFSEMLVPMLKRLNEDQKHYAQVKILNVLKKARQFDPLGLERSKYDVKLEPQVSRLSPQHISIPIVHLEQFQTNDDS